MLEPGTEEKRYGGWEFMLINTHTCPYMIGRDASKGMKDHIGGAGQRERIQSVNDTLYRNPRRERLNDFILRIAYINPST